MKKKSFAEIKKRLAVSILKSEIGAPGGPVMDRSDGTTLEQDRHCPREIKLFKAHARFSRFAQLIKAKLALS
jgi:hypothetical protein